MNSRKHTIVVTGARGQLGRELVTQLGDAAIPLDRPQVDFSDGARLRSTISELKPRMIINCAAYTQVDRAEDEPQKCLTVNAEAVADLAAAACDIRAKLVQISTDYVFGGDAIRATPYREDDRPYPLSVYGQSKVLGEKRAALVDDHLVVRTCGLYGHALDRPSFAATMLRLGREGRELRVVDDQHCTPSYVPHVAAGILKLLQLDARGTFHMVNSGATTWYGFASELFRQLGWNVSLYPITTGEYAARAPRPSYSVLDTTKFAELTASRLPDWKHGIREFVDRLQVPWR